MPTSAQKQHRIGTGGPWGTGLLLLGTALTMQGIRYAVADPDELSAPLTWIDHGIIPVAGWALLWIGAGIFSMHKALTPPQRHIELAPAVGVICLWAAIYGVYWALKGVVDGVWTAEWATSIAWAGLACVLVSFGRCVNPPRRRPAR